MRDGKSKIVEEECVPCLDGQPLMNTSPLEQDRALPNCVASPSPVCRVYTHGLLKMPKNCVFSRVLPSWQTMLTTPDFFQGLHGEKNTKLQKGLEHVCKVIAVMIDQGNMEYK